MKTKKRALSLLLAVLLMIGMFPTAAFAVDETGDISVSTAAELAALGGKDIEGNITLTNDIDMSGTAMEPIKSLTGCFNGDGNTISHLTLKGGKGSYNWQTGTVYVNTGLVGELDGSVINLKMTDTNITEGIDQYNNVGALVGKIADGSNSKIDNCVVSGNVSASAGNGNTLVGALVGFMSGAVDAHSQLTINNCVSDVALTGAASTYVGGLLGSAQYYSDVAITKCAELGDLSGSGNSSGVIGYLNSGSTALKIENSYVGGRINGKNKFGIAYNISALSSLSCTDFYYDSEKNKSDYSWSSFAMLNKGSVDAAGKSTADLKALALDGFAVSADFDGYPVPIWTPAAAPDPITPPAPTFSCALTFSGTEDGVLTVKDSSGTALIAVDGVYTLNKAGEYTYSVAFDEDSDYSNVADTTFTVEETDTQKNIAVKLTRKTTKPEGEGTQESPIQIGTVAELRYLAEQVDNGKLSGAYVELTDDITVPGSWTPLGRNAAAPFSGHFDGKGHSVTITVDDPNLSYFGFFGCLDSKLDRDSATPIDEQPTVTVENLTVNGTIYCSEPNTYAGGIAARARGKVELKNCVNNAVISSLARGSAGVGGLVGGYDDGVDYVYKNIRMTVDRCENNGTINVTGSDTEAMVGGLIGSNENCVQIKNSANTGTINAPGCTVGGLLGEAGSQTGDFVPSIADSKNTGTLIGAEGKTNNLYGKGTISDSNVTNSGDNTYGGGTESKDELLAESQKYDDVLAVSAAADVGDSVALIKAGETADESITVTCSLGERDTNRDYLKIENGVLKLAKRNDTGKVIEATATITWSKDGKSLSKPVTVNIYPAESSRKILMDNIAATYTGSSSDWVVFDMSAYTKLDGTTVRTSEDAKNNYLNLTVNELVGTSPLVTDRAKAEIILAALGVDSTKLKTVDGVEYSNAAKLADMNLGSSYYTAPWVLLAEQAGQVKLTDSQRSSMISLLTDSENLDENGLFFTTWAGETYTDPDTTGTALAALEKYNTAEYPKVQAFVSKAVDGLGKAQHSNGSYGNVNTDAMVITGLTAVGIDPASDSRFVKGGCSLADALLLYVNDAKNGFTTGYASGTQGEQAQALATEQGFRALVTLEKFASLAGDSKSFNIYTQTVKISQNGNTTVTEPEKPNTGYDSNKPGTSDNPGSGSTGGSGSGSTGGSGSEKDWISVDVTVQPDSGSAWYSGSLKVVKNTNVQTVLETAAEEGNLMLDIKKGYLSAVSYNGVTLRELDKGPNSGWLYKVNGKAPNVIMGDYKLTGGEKVLLYYTVDYTKESGLDISHSSSGGAGSTVSKTDQQSADTVAKLISAIGTVTKDSADKIAAARTAYDKLTAAQKKLVTNYDKLTAAEKAYSELTGSSALRFTDVAVSDYFYQAVLWAVQNKVASGTSDTLFVPGANCTRAQMVTFLWRAAGSPEPKTTVNPFADVPAGAYYEKAVLWAVESGITQGTSAAAFDPDAVCTRGQAAAFLYRGKNSPAVSGTNSFSDVKATDYYADAVAWATENNITNGIGNSQYGPAQPCTRGQIVTFLYRASVK